MMIIFDTPQGVNGEGARDFIVQALDKIAEEVHQGYASGIIRDWDNQRIGTWAVGAALVNTRERAA